MEIPSDRIRKRLPAFRTMLMENDKITLTRFQMFAWTWVGIISYLWFLFIEIDGKSGNFENLVLPGLPPLFVSLIGLSHVTYLTAKSVKPAYLSINEVRYERILLRAEKNFITILGSNFGITGSVWLEYYKPVTKEEMLVKCPYLALSKNKILSLRELAELAEDWKERYRYQHDRLEYCFDITKPAVVSPNLIRQDTRTVVSLDDIIYKLKSKELNVIVEENGSLSDEKHTDAEYVIRVERDGFLTYANSDAALKISTIPPKAEDVSVSTTVNKQIEIPLKASDPDVRDILTFIKVSDPSNGTLSEIDSSTCKITSRTCKITSSTGIVTYTPIAGFVGMDRFTFKANDGKVDGNIATVTISVK